MDKKTKITLDELLRRKEQVLNAKKEKRTKALFIPSLDGTVVITQPSMSVIQDAQGIDDPIASDKYLVYESVTEPNLKSHELQLAYGCGEPSDIVDMLFLPGEASQIAANAVKLAGFDGRVTPVEEIKN